jgi:hypothetical protein
MIPQSLLHYFYNFTSPKLLFDQYRVLSSDGTHSPVSKDLEKEGYKLTKKQTYVNGVINGLYDSLNNMVIDLCFLNQSEQKSYSDQIHLLQKNDIVIHDRGYFSKKLLNKLVSKGVHPIFRMKINSLYVKDLNKTNKRTKIYHLKNSITGETFSFRLVKYKIKKEVYYLGTTLCDSRFTINVLKNLYKKRWRIETYFKTVKYMLSFNDFHSQTSNQIRQEIYTHEFVTILTRIFEELHISENQLSTKMIDKQTNFKNNIDKVCNKIIYSLLYNSDYINTIRDIFKILFKYITMIRPDRQYARRRIKPVSKWYQYGKDKKE